MMELNSKSPSQGILIQQPWPHLMRGDIVLSRGADAVGTLIRVFTTDIIHGESMSEVSHAGIISTDGTVGATITEARAGKGVVPNPFYECYHDQYVCVIRDMTLDEYDRVIIASEARKIHGRNYTERTLLYQLLGLDRWLYRRYGDRWIICSWVAGYLHERVGRSLGGDHRKIVPDDTFDHCLSLMGKTYKFVIPPTWMPNNWPREYVLELSHNDLLGDHQPEGFSI